MLKTKYFDFIREAQENQKPPSELPDFDIARLKAKGFTGRLVKRILENPRWLLAILRRVRPIVALGPITVVTRDADVRDVLKRQAEFQTPFGLEMAEMAGGSNFILGMQDGEDYRRMKSACLSVFPIEEVEDVVRPIAARLAREAMRQAEPGFNPVHDLLKIVPVRICRDYFGLEIDDEESFADWSIALSSLFFADFFGDPATRELAVVAAERMNQVIARSIDAVRQGKVRPSAPLARLVAIHDAGGSELSVADIHAIMMGMVSGFVPTDLLAGGNCLDVVLSRREAQEAIEEAIAAGDDQLLDKAVREAMRFKPINVGPLRYTANDTTIAEGTSRARTLKAGTVVMPATLSAMFDPQAVRDPDRFDLDRPERDYLLFGHGIHWCIGSLIARTQIAECFRVLFERRNVRRTRGRKGRLARIGAFPASLHVDFDLEPEFRTVDHARITIAAPVSSGVPLGALRGMIADLGNPACPVMRAALDKTGVVHFASIAVVCSADPASEGPDDTAQLVLEISGDGEAADVIEAVAARAGELIRPVLEKAGALRPGEALAPFLKSHAVEAGPLPGQACGLTFSGTPGHSVKRIQMEERLQRTVTAMLRDISNDGPSQAMAIVNEVRRRLAEAGGHDWALRPAESLLEKEGPKSWKQAIWRAREFWYACAFLFVLIALLATANYLFLFGHSAGLLRFLARAGTSILISVAGLGIVFGLAVLGLRALFNRMEKADEPTDKLPALDRYAAIVDRENRGVQNHLTGLSVMKPGLMRRAALRIVYFVVHLAARHVFRPGYLADINTIHFARWILLPGTNRLLFFSNYGGSWESYLEDFITKAHQGLTGVWSNTVGFPRTRDLFLEGASDGDRFKRWARLQQIPTLFWYSAYPEIDTRRIRVNSKIRQGLARADTEKEARDWLANFGSLPAPVDLLEAPEIQGIVFGPMGALADGAMLAISIPESLSRDRKKAWLDKVLDRIAFGDRLPDRQAMICGFSAGGLRKLGLEDGPDVRPLDQFPLAFRQGMANRSRSRILDDAGSNAPETWLWGNDGSAADAVLVLYALDDGATLKRNLAAVRKATREAGMTIVHELPLGVNKVGEQAFEQFGFADGISQPVIDGTPRSRKPVNAMHRIKAGEFLLGYTDQRGYIPPSITLPASRDRDCLLALSHADLEKADPGANAMRDFGRNGTFLVVRQLQQHVDAFNHFCRETARRLDGRIPGANVTADWIGAKMVGRWKDGASMVRYPHGRPDPSKPHRPDNDFAYGTEDPQGTRCPLGAHIRRANPRDSLGPDRELQIELSKRHRILRVGRTYKVAPKRGEKDLNGREKGLLFMCLNADLERQFEFVQQTWVSSRLFHGLDGEKDPLVGAQKRQAHFTIPTQGTGERIAGLRNFVTMRGGGYFFLPGRRSLRYMLSRL